MLTVTTKAAVLELVQRLPDDVTLETIMSELLFRKTVDEGLRQLEAGETLSHEQVRQELQKWLK